MKTLHILALVALAATGMSGCTTQEEARQSVAPIATASNAPQRSYLDPGPAPARQGGPGYIRDNLTSSPRQTDGFGNDVLPPM
jgi:hypothetical protein